MAEQGHVCCSVAINHVMKEGPAIYLKDSKNWGFERREGWGGLGEMKCVNAGKRVGWTDEVKVYMEEG